MDGIDHFGRCQGIALEFIVQGALFRSTFETLDAMLLDVEDEVAWNDHIETGKNHGNLTLGIPVVEQPEELAMQTVFVFDDGAHTDIGDGEGYLILLLVNLFGLDLALLQHRLYTFAIHKIIGCSLQLLDALVSKGSTTVLSHRTTHGIEIKRYVAHVGRIGSQREFRHADIGIGLFGHDIRDSHLGVTLTTRLENLDTDFLTIVYQIAVELDGVRHVSQTTQHHSLCCAVGIIDRHVHLFIRRLTELHVHNLLGSSRSGHHHTQHHQHLSHLSHCLYS